MKVDWWVYGQLFDEFDIDITDWHFIRCFTSEKEAEDFIEDNKFNEVLGYMWAYKKESVLRKEPESDVKKYTE